MTEQPDQEAVRKAEGLTDALKAMQAELARVNKYGRRSRLFIALDVILTIGLALAGLGSVHAVDTANNASASQLALCQASNVARAQQIDLWDFLLKLGTKPRTAQEQKVIAAFEVHLHEIFRPRDCQNLGR